MTLFSNDVIKVTSDQRRMCFESEGIFPDKKEYKTQTERNITERIKKISRSNSNPQSQEG